MDPNAAEAFREFVRIVQALRTPGTGCPWDLEQDHQTLRPYLIEETYEAVDAIDNEDDEALEEELGDLLLQIVLHAQLAADRGAFTIADVVRGIAAKMVRRHPHVFGDTKVSGSAEVVRNWEALKAAEKGTAGDAFDRIPASLAALTRAERVGAAAGLQGSPLADLITCLEDLLHGGARSFLERALGAMLFDLCAFARKHGLDAEDCLRSETRRVIEAHRDWQKGKS